MGMGEATFFLILCLAAFLDVGICLKKCLALTIRLNFLCSHKVVTPLLPFQYWPWAPSSDFEGLCPIIHRACSSDFEGTSSDFEGCNTSSILIHPAGLQGQITAAYCRLLTSELIYCLPSPLLSLFTLNTCNQFSLQQLPFSLQDNN